MKRHRDHEELIVDYLLGNLPDVEMESFEHRYLEDETLFEELQEIEDELIDNYVTGALSVEHRAQFEQYFLRSPQRREKLEFARAMTEHAQAWKTQRDTVQSTLLQSTLLLEPRNTAADSETATGGEIIPFKRWSRPVPAWQQWAVIAAAVLMAVSGGFLWMRNRELHRELLVAQAGATRSQERANAQAARTAELEAQIHAEKEKPPTTEETPPSSPSLLRKFVKVYLLGLEYVISNARGEEKVKTVALPANAPVLRLKLELPPGEYHRLMVAVQHGNQKVWTSGVLKPRPQGNNQTVTVNIPARRLALTQYYLLINNAAAGKKPEKVAQYAIEVVRQ